MFFLGIDLGASSLKAALIDADGARIGAATHPLTTHHPAIGHAEQHPQDWLDALKSVLAQLGKSHPKQLAALRAISVTGGAHIGVLTDKDNTPLRAAIMWSDQRATAQAAALDADLCRAHSLNTPNPTWTLPQLIWCRTHQAALYKNCHRLSFAKDWVRDQLLDQPAHVTDCGEAVGGLLYDAQRGDWSDDLLAAAALPATALPQIVASDAVIGETGAAAKRLGLPANIPLIQGSIDTSIELLCCDMAARQADGEAAIIKLATAGVVSCLTSKARPLPPISLYPFLDTPHYYHAAGMSHCAAALDWLDAQFLGGAGFAELEKLAATVAAGADGVLFHPYLNGERAPHWSADLRAQLSGLHHAASRAHIARAGLEGVSFALLDILRDMEAKLARRFRAIALIGGGARSTLWAQILADMTDYPVRVPQHIDAAYGAALHAAHAIGHAIAPARPAHELTPRAPEHEHYTERFAAYDAIRAQMMTR